MIKSTQKRLLVAVDGTDRSLDTVRYLAQMPPFMAMDIVLFHIFGNVPECYWDIEKEPKSIKTVPHMLAWETQMRKNAKDFMEKCRDILLVSGYSPEQITIKIQNRKKGIARDILAEAQKDYGAVVLRRRGTARLKGLIMGDVSNKLLADLTFLPTIIAGNKPVNNKILIALDCSADAMTAVDYAGTLLGGKGYKIGLVHVLRSFPAGLSEPAILAMPLMLGEYIKKGKERIEPVFKDAGRRLIAHGFSFEDITTQIITDMPSRAGGIIREAENGAYGTIVMGRRGLSKTQSYFIGRVSNKVVQVGRRFTVWIVN